MPFNGFLLGVLLVLSAVAANAQQYSFNYFKHLNYDPETEAYVLDQATPELIITILSVNTKGQGTLKFVRGANSVEWKVTGREPEPNTGRRLYEVQKGTQKGVAVVASRGLYLALYTDSYKQIYSRTAEMPREPDPVIKGTAEIKREVTDGQNAETKPQVEEEVFIVVDDMPEFPGGESAMIDFLRAEFSYPDEARETKVEGTVYVNFVVEKDGTITNVKALKGLPGGCSEEAIRVVKAMPKWKPGKMSGKSVRVSTNLPITFKL